MSIRGPSTLLAIAAGLLSCGSASGQTVASLPVLTGVQLSKSYAISLNTSGGLTNWLSVEGATGLLMQYPAGQTWGSVFITYGPAVSTNRPGLDVSAYQSLVLELSGDAGTTVAIGIKDATQLDDGSETTVPVQISGDWQTYAIPLTKFTGANRTDIYVVTEFVFSGSKAQSLWVRNIEFSAATTGILPQFVFGGGWYSALYFTNTGGAAVSVPVSFVSDNGTPMSIPAVGASTTVSLAPRGSARIEAPNTGDLTQGYVTAALPYGVTGYGVFRQSSAGIPDQEAVVPFSGSLARTSTLIWDDTIAVTAVAMVNPSSVDATVAITVRDGTGQTIGTSSVALPSKTKSAVVLRTLPGLAGMAGNWGSADFSVTTGSVAVLGLRFNGQALTSIPTADR